MSFTGKLSKIILPELRELIKSSASISSQLDLVQNKYFSSNDKPKKDEPSKKKKNDSWFRRFLVHRNGNLKYGLYTEDLLDEDIEVVRIALERVPDEVRDARIFRGIRAMQLSINGEILPKHMWITYEEDLEYRYLTPYIKEVEKEMQEKRDYGEILEYWQPPRLG